MDRGRSPVSRQPEAAPVEAARCGLRNIVGSGTDRSWRRGGDSNLRESNLRERDPFPAEGNPEADRGVGGCPQRSIHRVDLAGKRAPRGNCSIHRGQARPAECRRGRTSLYCAVRSVAPGGAAKPKQHVCDTVAIVYAGTSVRALVAARNLPAAEGNFGFGSPYCSRARHLPRRPRASFRNSPSTTMRGDQLRGQLIADGYRVEPAEIRRKRKG